MSKDTGGAAFPGYDIYGDGKQHLAGHPHGGMTLRDYFAAKIMATFMHGAVLPPGFDAVDQLNFTAGRAYEVADAMLKERAK